MQCVLPPVIIKHIVLGDSFCSMKLMELVIVTITKPISCDKIATIAIHINFGGLQFSLKIFRDPEITSPNPSGEATTMNKSNITAVIAAD